MPSDSVPVRWEVAEDDGFDEIVREGVAVAEARWAHSVHVNADRLRPGRWTARARAGEVKRWGEVTKRGGRKRRVFTSPRVSGERSARLRAG